MNKSFEKYSRLEAIYSSSHLIRLRNSHIAIIGLGGVGSYCASALARSGVGEITLCDFDKIDESNINRQLFANEKTIGKNKVDVATQFIKDINPEVKINGFIKKINDSNAKEILENADNIVDAIDDVPAKITIAKYANENNIPFISCMGTAMKKDPSKLKFADIYKTDTCPLCKNVRKLAKENNISRMPVLYSDEKTIKSINGELGSTSYLPPIAGLMIAGKVIDEI